MPPGILPVLILNTANRKIENLALKKILSNMKTKRLLYYHQDQQEAKNLCQSCKKETPTQVFSCGICKTFKNTYFKEYLRTTASGSRQTILRNGNKIVCMALQ